MFYMGTLRCNYSPLICRHFLCKIITKRLELFLYLIILIDLIFMYTYLVLVDNSINLIKLIDRLYQLNISTYSLINQ